MPVTTSPVITPMRPSRPELGQRVAHLRGCPDGAERVVLVDGRHPEHGHHGVADELLDAAAVALDDALHALEVGRQQCAQPLRIDRFPEGRGTGQVAEQDRHDLALLALCGHRRSLGRWSRTGVDGCAVMLGSCDMSPPFRIGVMQLTMEPLDEMLASARAMDAAGIDTVWLAEAYPWWRKHQMEARGSTVVSALMARETERLTIGWGIISPYTRHPVQVAMDARVVQEAAGPGRFIVGFGTSKIFLNNSKQGGPPKVTKPLAHMRDSIEIVRGILGGDRFEYEGRVFGADVPALSDEAHAPRWDVPVYVAGTAPLMQQLGGELGDGLLTPSITTPAFVRYTRGNIEQGAAVSGRDPDDVDLGCTIVASIHASDRDAGRDGAREIAGMYLANKVQNIQGSADTLLELAEIEQDEIRPVAEAMEQGGRLAAKAKVTDALLDKCKPIAGTPADCIEAIEEYRDAGCTHVMLELWGDDRLEQIRLFGEHVLPRFRD